MPTSVTVSSGVTSSGLTISSGETLYVLSGGTVSGIIVSGGYEHVYSGGTDLSATVENGGTLDVYGFGDYEVVNSGGVIGIGSNGSSYEETVGTGGILNIQTGAGDQHSIVSGGIENVYGGQAYYTIIESGGAGGITGGFFDGAVISAGGTLNLIGGGIYGTTLDSGGVLHSGNGLTNNSLTNNGGTVLPLCFVAGSHLKTDRGLVAVEDLAVGEMVAAHFAGTAPIVWIGKRTIDCRRHARPEGVYPVRVRVGAFGEGVPFRDVFLSPDHAVFAGDVLVPVRELINGTSIAQVPVDEVTYYHVELAQHDVLFAEGLPAESYLDTGNRANFAGGAGAIALHPEFAARVWDAEGCAPLVIAGRELEAVRQLVRVGEVEPDCIEDRMRAVSQ